MKKKNSKYPLVSVLMPAYNAEKYIVDAINSILHQTYQNFELIILNDASTDKTKQIVTSYTKKDKRIIILSHKKNMGIPVTRNKLMQHAKGKYIAWQDADDISQPDRLIMQVIFLEKHPQVGIVGGFLQYFHDNALGDIRKYDADDTALREKIFRYSPVAQPVAMMRKKAVDEIGLYNVLYKVAQDLDFSFRIGEKYQFANIQKVLLHYREHKQSVTFSRLQEQINNTVLIRRKYAKSKHYTMSFYDKIFLGSTFLAGFLPGTMANTCFKILRNSSK